MLHKVCVESHGGGSQGPGCTGEGLQGARAAGELSGTLLWAPQGCEVAGSSRGGLSSLLPLPACPPALVLRLHLVRMQFS